MRVKERDPIHVLFLVNTTAPITFLRKDTMEALGFTDFVPESANVCVHGQELAVGLSHGNFAQVDLLGHDFFARLGGVMVIDYREDSCEIRSPAW